KIQNSKFKIQNSKFKIQNSKFKIQNLKKSKIETRTWLQAGCITLTDKICRVHIKIKLNEKKDMLNIKIRLFILFIKIICDFGTPFSFFFIIAFFKLKSLSIFSGKLFKNPISTFSR
ncbi:hypothetical protein DMUE_4729, partial [Dictyocoela muelleri]